MNGVPTDSFIRLYEAVYLILGDTLRQALKDENVNEVMCNPDGQLWIDHVREGMMMIGQCAPEQTLNIIHQVAGIQHKIIGAESPQLETTLPNYQDLKGERFTAQVPPVVKAPSFSIRKRATQLFTLDDYVQSQRITEKQSEWLRHCVQDRKNILVCGGPGSGKTTVTNALIESAVQHDDKQRFLILEDVPELQCTASNVVLMQTTPQVNLTGLVRTAMRMRPDRILVGEVRGSEAFDLLKAWNTGCPGGMATVHANGAEEAIQRLLDLSQEAGLLHPPYSLVAHTVDVIVFVTRKHHQKGFIQEILTLKGYHHGQFQFEKIR